MTHRALITLPAASSLPEDAVTNSLYFQVDPGGVEGALSALDTAIVNFYAATTVGISRYISNFITRTTNACSIRWYNLSDPEPRVPVRTTLFTLIAPDGTTNLPRENAIVLSFKSTTASGVNPRRRRGRIYIGPLITNAIAESNGDMRVSGTARTNIGSRAVALKTAALAANSPWSIWSPTGNIVSSVNDGWIDDAVDHQRRRGTRAVQRTVWV